MKRIKFKALLMITIIGVIAACNLPQSKDVLVADNAVSLTDPTLVGVTSNPKKRITLTLS
jgi:hypothetical protein